MLQHKRDQAEVDKQEKAAHKTAYSRNEPYAIVANT
jgi:hypothetical protein